ncbi:hypothetical protein [Paeniglutamicibacter kerguelensis]|uniref:Uncharacterized protein n=1 Tax=Paeniglutamicibacter kerguelensis TaxID=254788 RepID=A0ABS4XIW9_9MICC|nr:hypothetical protein [Paeniglutamicibacter kerguelensis]MBP2388342.1 hypothetical protein [Paeniglutamicibacter kerguelensis]MBP2388353.1 hypothetical protein [Paeniglutamicibacter kerguelensis]
MNGTTPIGLPPRRGVRKGNYDWDGKARLAQETPGVAVLAGEGVPESLSKSVRTYRTPPFIQADGRIVVNLRNSVVNEEGVRHGDIYLTWVPEESK